MTSAVCVRFDVDSALVRRFMTPDNHDLPTLESLLGRPAWMARGACRGTNVDPFSPTRGGSTAPAKAIQTCIVRPDCLAYGMEDPGIVGVWCGTLARERRRLRSALPAA